MATRSRGPDLPQAGGRREGGSPEEKGKHLSVLKACSIVAMSGAEMYSFELQSFSSAKRKKKNKDRYT